MNDETKSKLKTLFITLFIISLLICTVLSFQRFKDIDTIEFLELEIENRENLLRYGVDNNLISSIAYNVQENCKLFNATYYDDVNKTSHKSILFGCEKDNDLIQESIITIQRYYDD